jgi:hypothetical protein
MSGENVNTMKVRSRGAALLGAGILVLAGSLSTTVLAVGEKVTICHANSNENDPYVRESVDISSSGLLQGGHSDHAGDGVWYAGAKGDSFNWGDIIPPYDFGEFHYAGLNWADGEAIWDALCVVEGETEAEPTQSLATVTDPPSASPTEGVADVTPTFTQGVRDLTEAPTDTIGKTSTTSPADGAWLLVVALGVLLASIVVLTPARAKSQR